MFDIFAWKNNQKQLNDPQIGMASYLICWSTNQLIVCSSNVRNELKGAGGWTPGEPHKKHQLFN